MPGALTSAVYGTLGVAALQLLVDGAQHGTLGSLGALLAKGPAAAVKWLVDPTVPAVPATTPTQSSSGSGSSPGGGSLPVLPVVASSLQPLASPVSSAATGGQAILPPST